MNKHSLLNCDPCEECGNKFKKTMALQRELVEALKKKHPAYPCGACGICALITRASKTLDPKGGL